MCVCVCVCVCGAGGGVGRGGGRGWVDVENTVATPPKIHPRIILSTPGT